MKDPKPISKWGMIIFTIVLLNAIILRNGFLISNKWYWGLSIAMPLLLIAIIDSTQRKHAIKRT